MSKKVFSAIETIHDILAIRRRVVRRQILHYISFGLFLLLDMVGIVVGTVYLAVNEVSYLAIISFNLFCLVALVGAIIPLFNTANKYRYDADVCDLSIAALRQVQGYFQTREVNDENHLLFYRLCRAILKEARDGATRPSPSDTMTTEAIIGVIHAAASTIHGSESPESRNKSPGKQDKQHDTPRSPR